MCRRGPVVQAHDEGPPVSRLPLDQGLSRAHYLLLRAHVSRFNLSSPCAGGEFFSSWFWDPLDWWCFTSSYFEAVTWTVWPRIQFLWPLWKWLIVTDCRCMRVMQYHGHTKRHRGSLRTRFTCLLWKWMLLMDCQWMWVTQCHGRRRLLKMLCRDFDGVCHRRSWLVWPNVERVRHSVDHEGLLILRYIWVEFSLEHVWD